LFEEYNIGDLESYITSYHANTAEYLSSLAITSHGDFLIAGCIKFIATMSNQ